MSAFQIESGVEEEEKKLKSKAKSVEPDESHKIDLYRVFVDDSNLKTKNASINKLRDIKKEGRVQIKELDAQQAIIRERHQRKVRKIGIAAKIAASKGPLRTDLIPELSTVCQAINDKSQGQKEAERLAQSELAQMYINELTNSKGGPEVKLFYDYYALWVINKKVSDHQSKMKEASNIIAIDLPQHLSLLKNTFTQTLSQSTDESQPPSQNTIDLNHILTQCETELLDVYKHSLKSLKHFTSLEASLDAILSNKNLNHLQKISRQIIETIDDINQNEHQIENLEYGLENLTGDLNNMKEVIMRVGYKGKPVQQGLRKGKNNVKRNLIVYQK